jgi:ABC-2 type transport system permease protein
MKKFRTVFVFEYTNYVKSKAFLIVTAVFIALIAIAGSLPAFAGLFGGDDGGEAVTTTELGAAAIRDPAGVYTDGVLLAFFPDYAWERADDLSGVEARIADGTLDFAVSISGLDFTLYERSSGFDTSAARVSDMVQTVYRENALIGFGLSEADIAAILGAQPVGSTIVVGKDYSQSFILAYALLFLLYITMVIYGQYILTSVIVEKSSKAMELLVTSAKPTELMFGKVFGTGCAGLTQFGVIILAAVLSLKLNAAGWADFAPVVAAVISTSFSSGLFIYAVVFFMLGFFSFAFVYAALGSTVSRMEDANSVMTVPMFLFIGAFLVAMTGLMSPGATYIKVFSYLPFFSPLVMFQRICMSEIPTWESLLVIALNVGYILGVGWVGAKIYRVGVMLYGNAPKLRAILKYVTVKS